jgi:hypothetical protein
MTDLTMLQTNVEYIHQAFQRLVRRRLGQDVYAVISGPNGFCANHRITGLRLDRRGEGEMRSVYNCDRVRLAP